MIRLAAPLVEQDDLDAVCDVLRSGNLVQGARVAEFEAEVATIAGTDHAVAVTNCTAALELSLRAMGVGPGDRVAVAAYSWVSTANVVELVGATPVFVDVDVDTHNVSVAALEAAFDVSTPPAAVIPVDTFGNMAGLDAVAALASERGVPLLEDAACSLAARLDGRAAGSWGAAGCFSFHPRKAVTTGEGGVVTTDSADIARTVRMLRNHGMDPDADGPDFVAAGPNTRMTEFQAALGSTQLAKLPRVLGIRDDVAAAYEAALDGTGVDTPVRGPQHVLQSYVVLLPAGSPHAREVATRMRHSGVEASVGTWHLPLTTHFSRSLGHRPGDFPGTDEVFARALSLPVHHLLDEADVRTVVDTLHGVLRTG